MSDNLIFANDIQRVRDFTQATNKVARLYDDGHISAATLEAAALDISKALCVDRGIVLDEIYRLWGAWEEWEKA